MARFYFNIRDGSTYPDVDGLECPTLGHAQREAVRLAGYTLMTQPKGFWNGEEWTVEAVRRDRGVVFTVTFRADNLLPEEWLD